jgi:eukaryotic-like serine/threonine-protein kinase
MVGELILDRFLIEETIGSGGFGTVYRAWDERLQRPVAVKVIERDHAAPRVTREAQAVARLAHRNIATLYELATDGERAYLVSELIDGETVRVLGRRGDLSDRLVAELGAGACAALAHAHRNGVVHRDIKPENILLTRTFEVKVADFGLSRCFGDQQAVHLTQSNVTMGTPLYMSPEQVEGKRPIDHRSDIYSFGVTCYHMFAGHPPFRGTSPFEVAVQHVQKEPDPLAEIRPDLPADLCTIIHKMMAKQPEARYQTAREIMRDVSRLRDAVVVAGTTAVAPAARRC